MRSKSFWLLLCLILLCIFIPYSALASLRVTFFGTEAGGTALLQADGQTMLLGAGAEADTDVLLTDLADFDIQKIDLLASTQLKEDYIGGIGAVLDKYETGTLWLPGEQTDDQALADIQASGAKVVTPVPGDRMDVGNAKITVVKPSGQSEGAAPYLALRVEYGEHVFLFLPDAGALGEGVLPESGTELHADVLSAGGVLPQAILDNVSPLWAVISGEAQADALTSLSDSGIQILQPSKNGIVTFTSDGTAIQAEHEASGVVIQTSVNMRKEASTKAGRAATLSKGTVVSILGTVEGSEGMWYHVEAGGKVGFVRGDLIDEISNEEAEKLLAEATPKPKRSNSGSKNSGAGDDTQEEEAPAECH